MRKAELVKLLLAIPGNPEVMLLGYEDGYEPLMDVSLEHVDMKNVIDKDQRWWSGMYTEGKPGAEGVELVLVLQYLPAEAA